MQGRARTAGEARTACIMPAPAPAMSKPLPTSSKPTREEIEAALVREAKLLDKLVVCHRRQLAKTQPHRYLCALAEDDASLEWALEARGMRHIMIEAALKLQMAWRERPNISVTAKLKLRQQRMGERKKLRIDFMNMQRLREDLRAEALAYFEVVAPPVMNKLTQLRRRLSSAQNNQIGRPASGSQAENPTKAKAKGPSSHGHPTVAIIRATQEEVVKNERQLYELQEALLMCFHGAKSGRRMAENARLNPSGLRKRLVKAEAALPSELAGFTATLGNAGITTADEKAKTIMMERRRLLVAAVKAKPPETPMELWRAVRALSAGIDKCNLALDRVSRLLVRMAKDEMTAADHEVIAAGNWSALGVTKPGKKSPDANGDQGADNLDEGNSGDALDRALRTWLPKGFAEKLGMGESQTRRGRDDEDANDAELEAAEPELSSQGHASNPSRASSRPRSGTSVSFIDSRPGSAPPPPKPVLWACNVASASTPVAPTAVRPTSGSRSLLSASPPPFGSSAPGRKWSSDRSRSVTPALSEPTMRPLSAAPGVRRPGSTTPSTTRNEAYLMATVLRPRSAASALYRSPYTRPFSPYLEGTVPAHDHRGMRRAFGSWEFKAPAPASADAASPRANGASPRPAGVGQLPPRARTVCLAGAGGAHKSRSLPNLLQHGPLLLHASVPVDPPTVMLRG